MKPALLFVCHRIPYPPNKGDKIRSWHLLKHLSQHFRVFLGTFVDDPADWQYLPQVEAVCEEVLAWPLHPVRARLRSLVALLTGEALSLPYYRNASLQSWVNTVVQREGIVQAVAFSSPMAQYLERAPAGLQRRVVDFVDVDSDKWAQYAEHKQWPMSAVYRREARCLLAYERQVAAAMEVGTFVSDSEAALFRELAPESAARVDYFNNGVDRDYFSPVEGSQNPYGDQPGPVLVFTGAMDYWPNEDAVDHFARDILPVLQQSHKDLRFFIVGSRPSTKVQSLAGLPGVSVTGRVEDIRPYIQYATAAVAPMRVARGVQNKVLEAMAMGRPVLVSAMGLEGIPARDGEHVYLVETAAHYEAALARVMAGEGEVLGAGGRHLVQAQFDWEANLASVSRHLQLSTAGGLE